VKQRVVLWMQMQMLFLCFLAAIPVHCAAATQNFLALENHSLDVPWWSSMVQEGARSPIVDHGWIDVPDRPGPTKFISTTNGRRRSSLRENTSPAKYIPAQATQSCSKNIRST